MSFHTVIVPSLAVTSTAAVVRLCPRVDISNFRTLAVWVQNSSTSVIFSSVAIIPCMDGITNSGTEYNMGSGPETNMSLPSDIGVSSLTVGTPMERVASPYLILKGKGSTTATAGTLTFYFTGHA